MKFNTAGLGDYFKSLMEIIAKKDIVIDLHQSYSELEQIVIPMYDLDITGTFEGKVNAAVEAALKKSNVTFSRNAYFTIAAALKKIDDQQEKVMDMIDNEFTKEVVKSIIDYKKLNVLKYVEALNFLNDYSRRFILAVVHDEYEPEVAAKITGPVDKANHDWVMDYSNIQSFIKVLEILTMPVSKFLDSLKALEGHVFNTSEYEALRGTSNGKIDPHGFGFVSPRWNPVYHIGLAVNAWRIARHERNKEELAKLQLMVMALEEQKSKSSDPEKIDNLAKQIKYRSNQINKLEGKIANMEEG